VSQPQAPAANYCYRHPNRQSFVLCQRCGRTICGECQTPAAVGMICPECMRQQRASAPRTSPRIVSRVRTMSAGGAPVVTYAIIALCIVVFILQSLPGIGSHVTAGLQYAGFYSYPQFAFEPWRMITSIFAHASIIHIGLNMYTLWIFGQVLEPMIGRGRYLVTFLLAGFGGSLGVMFLAAPNVGVIGASGAIFGMLGALLVIHRRLGGNITQLLVLVLINLVIGFLPGLQIAWQAHLGGLIVGGIVGLILVETRPRSRQGLQVGLLVLLAVVLVVLSLWHLAF